MIRSTKRVIVAGLVLASLAVAAIVIAGCAGGGGGVAPPISALPPVSNPIGTVTPTPAEVAANKAIVNPKVAAAPVGGVVTATITATVNGTPQAINIEVFVTPAVKAAAAANTLVIPVVIQSLAHPFVPRSLQRDGSRSTAVFDDGTPAHIYINGMPFEVWVNKNGDIVKTKQGQESAIGLYTSGDNQMIVVPNLSFVGIGAGKSDRLDVTSMTMTFTVRDDANSIPTGYNLTLPVNHGSVGGTSGSVSFDSAMSGKNVTLEVNSTGANYRRTVPTFPGPQADEATALFTPGLGTSILGDNVTVNLTATL